MFNVLPLVAHSSARFAPKYASLLPSHAYFRRCFHWYFSDFSRDDGEARARSIPSAFLPRQNTSRISISHQHCHVRLADRTIPLHLPRTARSLLPALYCRDFSLYFTHFYWRLLRRRYLRRLYFYALRFAMHNIHGNSVVSSLRVPRYCTTGTCKLSTSLYRLLVLLLFFSSRTFVGSRVLLHYFWI